MKQSFKITVVYVPHPMDNKRYTQEELVEMFIRNKLEWYGEAIYGTEPIVYMTDK